MQPKMLTAIGMALVFLFGASEWTWAKEGDTKAKQQTIGDLACGADEIPKFNGSEWVCSFDDNGVSGLTNRVLVDANGETVLRNLGYLDSSWAGGEFTIEIAGNLETFYAYATPEGLQNTGGPASSLVWFTGLDCTGTALVQTYLNRTLNFYTPRVYTIVSNVSSNNNASEDYVDLYFSSENPQYSDRQVVSQRHSSTYCVNVGPRAISGVEIAGSVDLTQLWSPPFTLRVN